MSEEKSKEVEITFNVSGYIKQNVMLKLEYAHLTPDEIAAKLNSGEWVTTIQNNGTVDISANGEEVGQVTDIDNNLEYENFQVEEEE